MENNAVTIVIASKGGFATRYLLRSAVAKHLIAAKDKIVALVSNPESKYIEEEFKKKGVQVERLIIDPKRTWLGKWAVLVRQYVYPYKVTSIGSAAIDQRLQRDKILKFNKNWALGRLGWKVTLLVVCLLRRSRLLRRFFVTMEAALSSCSYYRNLFKKYRPDVVITLSPGYGGWDFDTQLLREAKKHAIPTICVIMSWDNPSSKGYLGIQPDYVLCWSDIMKRECMGFQDIPSDKIKVVGSPIFDIHADTKKKHYRNDKQKDIKSILLCTHSPTVFQQNVAVTEGLASAIANGELGEPCKLVIRLHPLNFSGRIHPDVEQFKALALKYPFIQLNLPKIYNEENMDLPWDEVVEISKLLIESDVVVTFFSTVQLEAAALNKPIINIAFDVVPISPGEKSAVNNAKPYHIARVIESKMVQVAYSPNQLIDLIRTRLHNSDLDKERRLKLVTEECGPLDGKSAERIATTILNIARKSRI